jgi:hypothetical protein
MVEGYSSMDEAFRGLTGEVTVPAESNENTSDEEEECPAPEE